MGEVSLLGFDEVADALMIEKSTSHGFGMINALVGVLALMSACASRPEQARKRCEQNMEIILIAARSYSLERRLSCDSIIDSNDLRDYLKGGTALRCPLGQRGYAPFIYTNGPVCPNAPRVHTLPRTVAVELISKHLDDCAGGK
jgi:hypothetical protein